MNSKVVAIVGILVLSRLDNYNNGTEPISFQEISQLTGLSVWDVQENFSLARDFLAEYYAAVKNQDYQTVASGDGYRTPEQVKSICDWFVMMASKEGKYKGLRVGLEMTVHKEDYANRFGNYLETSDDWDSYDNTIIVNKD